MAKTAGLKCRDCGRLALQLFGHFLRPELLDNIHPKTAKKYAAKALYCPNQDCEMPKLDKSFCPKCKKWRLKCDLWAHTGLKFVCATRACRLQFTALIKI